MQDFVPEAFIFQDSQQIRTIIINEEPWFVAKDVAVILGYQRPGLAIQAHCKGAVKRSLLSSGGMQETTTIPERDVYRLIMRSKLPSAQRFEEWVVSEVLPAIRKTGSYAPATAKHQQAVELFNSSLTSCLKVGLTTHVAMTQASQSTYEVTGIDVSKMLGFDKEYLTIRQMAEKLGTDCAGINALLYDCDLHKMANHKGCIGYMPTLKGMEYAVYDDREKDFEVKWHKSIVAIFADSKKTMEYTLQHLKRIEIEKNATNTMIKWEKHKAARARKKQAETDMTSGTVVSHLVDRLPDRSRMQFMSKFYGLLAEVS